MLDVGCWMLRMPALQPTEPYCFSYSPLPTRLRTLKPAFFASEIESALGELNVENSRRTGFLQAGHLVKGAAESGRRKVNLPPHTLQSPSHNSYSYSGMSQLTLPCSRAP